MKLSGILKKRNQTEGNRNVWVSFALTVTKATLFAVATTIVLFLLAALLLWILDIDDSAVPFVVQAVRIVCIVIAGIICGRNVEQMGWLAGLLSGFLYIVLTVVIGLIFYQSFSFDGILIADILLGCGAGFLAGMIGINLKKK